MYTHTHTIYIYLSLFHGAHRLNFTAVIRWNSDCIVGHGSSLFVKTQEMPKGQFMNHVGMALVAVDMALGHFSSCIDSETIWNLWIPSCVLDLSDGDLVVTIIKKKLIDIIVDGVGASVWMSLAHDAAEGWDELQACRNYM